MKNIQLWREKKPGSGSDLFLFIALIGVLILFPAGVGAEEITPCWEKGDTWSVRVAYATQDGGWSEPLLWRYRVTAVTGTGSQGYTLDVTGPVASVTLTYRSDFSLVGVRVVRTLRGTDTVTILTYDHGVPVLTERSPVPFDTPLFPLVSSFSGVYSARASVGKDLHTTQTVRQTVESIAGTVPVLEVRCMWGKDTSFVQRWEAGRPWPVSGENPKMRYRLVEP